MFFASPHADQILSRIRRMIPATSNSTDPSRHWTLVSPTTWCMGFVLPRLKDPAKHFQVILLVERFRDGAVEIFS